MQTRNGDELELRIESKISVLAKKKSARKEQSRILSVWHILLIFPI